MRAMIFNVLKDILWNIWNWFASLTEIPFQIPVIYISGVAVISVILLISAAWAANIAENKGHHPHLHFLLGLLIPFIYPAIILFVMNTLEGSPSFVKEYNKNKQKAAVAQRTAQIAATAKAAKEQQELEEADPTFWNKTRMKRLVYNEDGSASGPFICTLSDGKRLRVLTVRDLQDEIAVFELAGETPETNGLIMRFPYTRIHGMELDKQV